jgi:hypothetical protein
LNSLQLSTLLSYIVVNSSYGAAMCAVMLSVYSLASPEWLRGALSRFYFEAL